MTTETDSGPVSLTDRAVARFPQCEVQGCREAATERTGWTAALVVTATNLRSSGLSQSDTVTLLYAVRDNRSESELAYIAGVCRWAWSA